MSATATTTNDPVAKAIKDAKEPITEFLVSLPESGVGTFPIPSEDAQTSETVIDAVSSVYAEAARSDITCEQKGGQLTITLRSKPAGKG